MGARRRERQQLPRAIPGVGHSGYERFLAFNGGQLWFRDPRLFGKRLIGLAQVEWLFRPRPEYTRRRLQGSSTCCTRLKT